MTAGLLLDTHVLVRWLSAPKFLSNEQRRVIERAANRHEPLGISAMTLLEIAVLSSDGKLRLTIALDQLFDQLQASAAFRLFPLTYEIALEAAYLGVLRDPADRSIVATARVHGLRLVSSDERILKSNLVSVVE